MDGINKASLISVMESPRGPPKVEESVIMVDYFNPNKNKANELK